MKALQQHTRVLHGECQAMNRFVGDNICPACHNSFADRLRVIAHPSEIRQRSKIVKVTCRDQVLLGSFSEIPADLVKELDDQAREQRKSARRAGHSRPVVPSHLQAAKRPLSELITLPKRRLRAKTLDAEACWTLKRPAAWRAGF